MITVYTSDLHGNHRKYKDILNTAIRIGAKVVVFGGDLTPKSGSDFNGMIKHQEEWLSVWFRNHLKKYKELGIRVLGIQGNDDAAVNQHLLEEFDRAGLFGLLDGRSVLVDDIEFIGMAQTPISPFSIKDWELLDFENAPIEMQRTRSVVSQGSGEQKEWKAIPKLGEFVNCRPTIKDTLEGLPIPKDPSKAIYVIHTPPANLLLDVVGAFFSGGVQRKVGSHSVYRFLKKVQPLMSLHGHIHESPRETGGRYYNRKGGWLAVQPGQLTREVFAVTFETDDPYNTLTHTKYPKHLD
jgi:Icc-related predicted phosphoesterase